MPVTWPDFSGKPQRSNVTWPSFGSQFQPKAIPTTSPYTQATAMDPITIALLLASLGQGVVSSIQGSKQASATAKLQQQQQVLNEQDLALRKSMAGFEALTGGDPFARQRGRVRGALQYAMGQQFKGPVGIRVPEDIQSSMPTITNKLGIPEGGFGPEVLGMLSPQSRLASEKRYDELVNRIFGVTGGFPDYNTLGYQTEPTLASQLPSAEALRAAVMAGIGRRDRSLSSIGRFRGDLF